MIKFEYHAESDNLIVISDAANQAFAISRQGDWSVFPQSFAALLLADKSATEIDLASTHTSPTGRH